MPARTLPWIAACASLFVFAGAPEGPSQRESTAAAQQLSDTVEAIRHADYRGERDELRRLAQAMPDSTTADLEKYRLYWRGFAYWRRAINGFNETSMPGDLMSDLELASTDLRAALRLDPSFEDAKSALAGCLMSEMFLASTKPAEVKTKIYEAGIAAIRALKESATDNPRSLWILGGNEMGAPPPWGGDMVKAAAIYERGLAAARREASQGTPAPWIPRWGAPECLMSLAYLHSHGIATRRDLARAYALGALAAAPDWHYVADILLPSIEALPAATGEAAAAAPAKTACLPPAAN